MSDILATLGLTTKTPDPTLYANQKTVMAQLETVKKDLGTMLDSMNIAVQLAGLVRVPREYLDQLEGVRTSAKELLGQTSLTPDQLEKKRVELQGKFEKIQLEMKTTQDTRMLEDAEKVAGEVDAALVAVEADGDLSDGLKQRYRDLKKRAEEERDGLKRKLGLLPAVAATVAVPATQPPPAAQPPAAPPPPAAQPPAAEGFQAAPAAPPPAAPAEIRRQLQLLELDREKEEETTFSPKRFLRRTLISFQNGIIYLLILLAGLLGGSILANSFFSESFWLIRLFYFVYGALAFPLTILYGIFKPPVWRSLIFPYYQRPQPIATSITETLFSFEPPSPAGTLLSPELTQSRSSIRYTSAGMAAVLAAAAIFYDLPGYYKRGG